MVCSHKSEELTCQTCYKTYANVIKLKYHIHNSHTKSKENKCLSCDATYKEFHFLCQHVERYHRFKKHLVKTVICDICGTDWFSKYRLDYHMKTYHIGGFKCFYKDCHKGFRMSYDRKKHYLKVHKCKLEVII